MADIMIALMGKMVDVMITLMGKMVDVMIALMGKMVECYDRLVVSVGWDDVKETSAGEDRRDVVTVCERLGQQFARG